MQCLCATCVCTEDFTNSFYKVIYDCIDKNVPHSTSKSSHRNTKRPYPLSVRKLETKKRQGWKLYKAFRSVSPHTKYEFISSKCRQANFDPTRKLEESIINSGNLGKFFRYANSRLATKHNVCSLRFSNGSITIDPSLKAELLSEYFDSVYTVDNDIFPTTASNHVIDSDLSSITFNATIVSRFLEKLNFRPLVVTITFRQCFLINVVTLLLFQLLFYFKYFSITHFYLRSGAKPMLRLCLRKVMQLVLIIIDLYLSRVHYVNLWRASSMINYSLALSLRVL